jgi:hypothetical protein
MKQGVLTNGRVRLLMSPGDQVRAAARAQTRQAPAAAATQAVGEEQQLHLTRSTRPRAAAAPPPGAAEQRTPKSRRTHALLSLLTHPIVCLLLHHPPVCPCVQCFRGQGRRNGERRRKSVRGCVVSPDLSVLNLVSPCVLGLRVELGACCCCAAVGRSPALAAVTRHLICKV